MANWDWQGTAFDWMPEDNYSGDWGNYVQTPDNQVGYSFDDTWEPDFDAEFFAPTGEYGDNAASQYSSSTDIPSYLTNDAQQVTDKSQSYTAPEKETKNSWFGGLLEGTKDFAGTDLGKQVISGGISGLGTAIMQSMNENAQEKRARDARRFEEEQARLNREHQIKLKSMSGGGGGGAGPATTKATTSSLDQNIIKT